MNRLIHLHLAMTRDGIPNGDDRRRWFRGVAYAAAVVLALTAVAAVRADDADARGAEEWTRTIQVRLSPQQLGLPASTAPARLARAALRRSAGRLGLPRSLAGVRLERDQRVPAGRGGGVELHSVSFRQTSGGRRVLWSKIEVTIGGSEVRSISATVVPVKSGRAATRPQISARRALLLAHRAVAGREAALVPQLVAYAGNPGRGTRPRLAYLVETLPADAARREFPTGLCVVLDARTGKLLTTWKGSAARFSGRGPRRSAGAQAARVTRERIILLRDARVPSVDPPVFGLQTGAPYASWAATGNSFLLANWDASPVRFTRAGAVQPGLEAAVRNTRDVLAHMCFTRAFCSRDGRSDGTWAQTQVTGNVESSFNFYMAFQQRVYLTELGGYRNDVVAHELGHHIVSTGAGDVVADHEGGEVGEGIADMFAQDFDREDPTLGEDGPRGKNTETNVITNWATSINGQPFRMSQYRCNADVHFNATILSHAYYSFVQKVGPQVAGLVLYRLPAFLGPDAGFVSVANAFVNAATASGGSAQVAAAARQAFLAEGGMTQGPPPCSAAAPPPTPAPAPTPPPAPAPAPPPAPAPAPDVAVPDVRGRTLGAATSAITAAGLTIGTQRSVVDDTCNDIGAVMSQTPSAGTRVAPGTAVNLSIGQRPTHPCP